MVTVRGSGYALEYATKEIRGDKDIVIVAVKSKGCALEYASKELQGDREVVMLAVKSGGFALKYTWEILRGNRDRHDGGEKELQRLFLASSEMKRDDDAMMAPIGNPDTWEYISIEFFIGLAKQVISLANYRKCNATTKRKQGD